MKKINWIVMEDHMYRHVLPQSDILPHGVIPAGLITDGMKIPIKSYDCPCGAVIVSMDKGIMFDKFLVQHRSFEQMRELEKIVPHDTP